MAFKIEVFQNRYLPPGQRRVDAILSVTADPSLRAEGDLVIGFILDKSGSMQGSRIAAVTHAVTRAIALLEERTRFFVVAFDGHAYVIVPETRATDDAKGHAARAIAGIQAAGGTAMSTGLAAARAMFERAPNAIRRAIFLTDGKNEGEKAERVTAELEKCGGAFECDCWGVGTDWKVGEVQTIAGALLGKAALIPEPDGIEAAFRGAIERASGKALKDVRLRMWTPQGADVAFVKQVNPTIDDMTAKHRAVSAQVRDFMTGSWAGGESRDFHLAIDVRAANVGDEMLAARPSLVYLTTAPDAPSGWTEMEDKSPDARIFASWTSDEALTSRLDNHVAHYTGQGELAVAIEKGLAASEQGDDAKATQLLGRAVKLAHAAGNADMTQRLARVVDVVDAVAGTVRLKKEVKKAATMDLMLESRTTKRVSKK